MVIWIIMKEDEIAQQVAQFILNHEQHILDNVGDFGLLLPMLNVIKAYSDEKEANTEDNTPSTEES
jgi:hypothetical protein